MNRELLKYCLRRIEEQLGWTSSDLWLNQDFQLLSDKIFEETNVKLSITTLKRVWGKVSYTSEPSISTLNTLAKFIGYDNWSELKNSQGPIAKTENSNTKPEKPILSKTLVRGLLILGASIVIFSVFSITGSTSSKGKINVEQVSFGVHPVTLGLPNSVVFKYDFGSSEVEKCAIQQSWNEKLTFEIDPNGKEATGIYYYPGYFRAKLIADGEILKEQDLHIRTNGWVGTISEDEVPRYLYYNELEINGKIGISSELLKELHTKEVDRAKTLTYHYFDDMSPVKGDNFTFEVRFRNTYKKSNGICQQVSLLVHGKDAIYLTPFSIPGCTSDINLILAGETFSGKKNDLSMFGIEASEWQNFRLEVANQQAQYFLNDQLIMTKNSALNIGDIVGFKLRFEGAGEVDYLQLSNESGIVFEENFDH